MTIAINPQDFRSSAPFDPERWRRIYAQRSTDVVRPRRAPRREFGYQHAVRSAGYVPTPHSGAESSGNIVTLLVAALLTALVVIGLVAIADFASGGGAPSGLEVTYSVGAGESMR